MNHITALAVAKSINQDRLDAADRRRFARRPEKPAREQRRSHFVDMIRAYMVGYRAKPEPTR